MSEPTEHHKYCQVSLNPKDGECDCKNCIDPDHTRLKKENEELKVDFHLYCTEYEESLRARIQQLTDGLESIKKHQETIAGTLTPLSMTWQIVSNLLKGNKDAKY